ncbi:hypothetical protein VTK73DRAFT_3927 [Phialemonium thermophilum]|uniref:Uncharacterized protein n=1 Tax=Phialemonium thermophilum TaxID=223376 RepID=A0ABR3VD48_9PEZI
MPASGTTLSNGRAPGNETRPRPSRKQERQKAGHPSGGVLGDDGHHPHWLDVAKSLVLLVKRLHGLINQIRAHVGSISPRLPLRWVPIFSPRRTRKEDLQDQMGFESFPPCPSHETSVHTNRMRCIAARHDGPPEKSRSSHHRKGDQEAEAAGICRLRTMHDGRAKESLWDLLEEGALLSRVHTTAQ